jgi:hypothetical protein
MEIKRKHNEVKKFTYHDFSITELCGESEYPYHCEKEKGPEPK